MENYEGFKRRVFSMTKIDLDSYKEKQMRRRIDSLVTRNNCNSYDEYVDLLKKDSNIFDEFINFLTINVSQFYRNIDQWELLHNEYIPFLISKFGRKLKVWSAACSTGHEPYSLVMALSKFIPLSDIHILATDIDKQVLAQAQTGLYSEKSIANVPAEFKTKYFTKVGSSYKISDQIKNCVEFKTHDLLRDVYPTNCDMIVCRNVLIYFTEEAKEIIYRKFYSSLKNDAILFIGSTEQVMDYREIGYDRKNSFFYQKGIIDKK